MSYFGYRLNMTDFILITCHLERKRKIFYSRFFAFAQHLGCHPEPVERLLSEGGSFQLPSKVRRSVIRR